MLGPAVVAIKLVFVTFVCSFCLPAFALLGHKKIDYSFYSQTLYDARISGATNESRLRLELSSKDKSEQKLTPFIGLNYSQDLSNGRAPILTENMVAPSLGVQYRALDFLYAFGEARRLYRVQNEKRTNSEEELRYGLFAYDLREFGPGLFNEFYAESVVVDRVDTRPVTSAFNKFGKRFRPLSWLRPDLYAEGFTRISPNLGYGPDENELRLGSRVTFIQKFWNLSFVVNYAPISDVEKNGIDTQLVLSRQAF